MKKIIETNNITVNINTYKLIKQFLQENPDLRTIIEKSPTAEEWIKSLKNKILTEISKNKNTLKFYKKEIKGREVFDKLERREWAAIRILDNIDYSDKEYEDKNLRGQYIKNEPFKLLWLACRKGKGGITTDFMEDIIALFRQYNSKQNKQPNKLADINTLMKRYPSGLEKEIVEERKKNKDRIIKTILSEMEKGNIKKYKYTFEKNATKEDKIKKLNEWWETGTFHLSFAIKTPELLNKMLDNSLDKATMQTMERAQKAGIPFFVNPYYLSLLSTEINENNKGADLTIRDYILCSEELIEEFGNIVAWEKEDEVEEGKPNAAGWILPTKHNLHRRYPEVAILIPDTIGRACAGLCVSCQRMYDFQRGNLNFDLDKLAPKESWKNKLKRLLKYYEDDTQLRDILLTGGDALMSSDNSLAKILNEIYNMAVRKKQKNKNKKDGKKSAEILRIRLGTRLPVYLPQRITKELQKILSDFKDKASKIGIKQFVIQTHFESPMELTPEVKQGIERLLQAGWMVTNQLVFTVAASRRGHTAKLRKVLNECGILTYYTFSVKGYKENSHNFATNARAMQEQLEEKSIGNIPEKYFEEIKKMPEDAENMVINIKKLKEKANIPFLATDRNVINLPGVGKSQTYRTIGMTYDGRRILEFDHDKNRTHSPIIDKMGNVIIIESKSMSFYLKQLEEMGEDLNEYKDVYSYCLGETEPRMPIYEYPEYDYGLTDEVTNLEI